MKPRTRQMLAYQRAHEEALREDAERQIDAARADEEFQERNDSATERHAELLEKFQGEEVFEIPEGLDLEQVVAALENTEAELGLERTRPEQRMNRKQRRDAVREIKRVTRRPSGVQRRLEHPALKSLTPWGVKELLRRRARAKMARKSRQAQYRQAAAVRRRRQKINERRRA